MNEKQIQKCCLNYLQQLLDKKQTGMLKIWNQQCFVYVCCKGQCDWGLTKVEISPGDYGVIRFASILWYAASQYATPKHRQYFQKFLKPTVQGVYEAFFVDQDAITWDNQFKIFTPTQVIDVRTRKVVARNSQKFALPLAYDYHDKHDPIKVVQWQKLLKQVFPETQTLQMYFEMMGLSFIADRSLATAYFVIGKGSTGKTTLGEKVLRGIHHPNLVSNIAPQSWRSESFLLSAMVGKLVNIYGDSNFNRPFEIDAFKIMTEGGILNINVKFKASFQTTITALLVSFGNAIPPIKDMNLNTGVSRRIKIIPMNETIADVDAQLGAKITTNQGLYQGFLAYLIHCAIHAVCDVYHNGQLTSSLGSQEAMEHLRIVNSDIATFLASDFLKATITRIQNNGDYGIKWQELPLHYTTFTQQYNAQPIRPFEVKRQIQFIIENDNLPKHLKKYQRHNQSYLQFKSDIAND